MEKIIILGGGPCGLGAAWRLNETGHRNWKLLEKNNFWGGLATSYQDEEGFWWDVGGHVLFSHYPYFDKIMDKIFNNEKAWLFHEREAWIWMQDRFIPYPLQNNIHNLPNDIFWECIQGIIDITRNNTIKKPSNFAEWIDTNFGQGIAKWFLNPYNFKVWAYPVEDLSASWVGERVSKVDLKKVIYNQVYQKNDISWGPNSKFRFPLYEGTGSIWKAIAKKLPADNMMLNADVKQISTSKKEILFNNGTKESYDILISTLPITDLIKMSDLTTSYNHSSNELKYSSSHIVGLALNGNPPEHLKTKCWIYFPENNSPFYRVTVFSNYSPNNVPDIKTQWSLMCEVSESPVKKVDSNQVVEDVIQGALNTHLIPNKNIIDHVWYKSFSKGYPTPSLKRNKNLFPLLNQLEQNSIYSRGRFGAWRYEVGNMDHSFMQGVESVNHILFDGQELTLWYPDIVNSPHPSKTQ